MKRKISLITTGFICLLTIMQGALASAQSAHPQALINAGGQSRLANYTIDWTLGEWMVETYSSGPVLEQGFLHAFEVKLTTTSRQMATLPIKAVSIWPNPTSDIFNLDLTEVGGGTLHIINSLGNVIKRWDLTNRDQVFRVTDIPSGYYQLLLQQGSQYFLVAPISIIH